MFAFFEFSLDVTIGDFQLFRAGGIFHGRQQFVRHIRFFKKVVGTLLQRIARRFEISVAADDNDLNVDI